jgi:hypothetical protein
MHRARGTFATTGERKTYLVRLAAGKLFSAAIDGPAILSIVGVADGTTMVGFAASAVTWGGTIPSEQAYLVEVQSRAPGAFTLTTQVR